VIPVTTQLIVRPVIVLTVSVVTQLVTRLANPVSIRKPICLMERVGLFWKVPTRVLSVQTKVSQAVAKTVSAMESVAVMLTTIILFAV
jgi:hypothetical protein